jgi:hypothetical protein
MRSELFAASFLLLTVSLSSQVPANTAPASLRQTLEVSKRRGQLEMEGAPPFHLVASFEYLLDGGTMEKGTLDELWKDSHHFRQSISLPNNDLVEVDNDLQAWRTGEWVFPAGRVRYEAIDAVTRPFYSLPTGDLLTVEGQQHGSKDLDCVGTEPTLPGVSPTLLIAETTFCMARGNHLLHLIAYPKRMTITFSDIQPFQNKYIPRLVEIYLNATLVERLHVDSLTTADDFAVLDSPVPPEAQRLSVDRKDQPYYGSYMIGQVLRGADTLLPHLGHQGTALIKAHVNTKGDVASTEVISSPNPFISNAALSSVRNWKYRVGYDGDHLIEFDDVIKMDFDH